jgi:hypothetical protein
MQRGKKHNSKFSKLIYGIQNDRKVGGPATDAKRKKAEIQNFQN